MDVDFSQLNLQYLIQARDVARVDGEVTAVLLGTPTEFAEQLAQVSPADLAHLTAIKVPLLVPRGAPWWWARLFQALREDRPGELEAVLAHAGLVIAP